MFYYKIKNLLRSDGTADYKGLVIDKIERGSQLLSSNLDTNNFCIIASSEDKNHIDLIKITEEEYNTLKEQMPSKYPPQDKTESEIELLKKENADLRNSLADLWEVVLLGGAE